MSSPELITVSELAELRGAGPAPVLLDVLPAEQFERRHLPGALNAGVYQVSFLLDVANVGIAPDSAVVVYATSDRTRTADDAAEKLCRAGFREVRVLEGGVEEWVRQGMAVEGTGAPEPAAPPPPEGEDLEVDVARSTVRWVGRNLAGRHDGQIGLAGGALQLEGGSLIGGRVEIDMTAITCSNIADGPLNRILIEHLESDDFFDVDQYPRAVFEITDAEPMGAEIPGLPNQRCTGLLTLKGVSAPVRMMLVTGRTADGEWVAQANFDLDRTRFDVNYGSGKFYDFLGKHLVNDLISVELVVFGG